MNRPRQARWMRWIIGAIVALRLIFISHDEIRPFPYDEAAYIMQAKAGYWGNAFNAWTYTRQPGFPLFIAASARLGLPLRITFELMWILTALMVARACRRAGLHASGRLLLFALLLFHPFATQLFCRALADNLYTAAWLLFTVATASAISCEGPRPMRRWGFLAAATAAVTANTRQETVLIYTLGALAAGVVFLSARRTDVPVRALRRQRLLAGVLLPMLVTFGSVQCVNFANWRCIGAYVGCDWALPGFKALYRTLLAIRPEHPSLLVPIATDVRAKAAAASPTFARLLPIIQAGERWAPYRRDGERITGVPGEPGPFNLQCIHDGLWELHEDRFASAAEYDQFCWQIVNELRGAAQRGQLPLRWAPLSFVPPEWGQLALAVPRAIPVCWERMTTIGFDRAQLYPVGPDERRGFDEMALRRTSLVALERRGPLPASIERADAAKRAWAACWPWVAWALLASWLGGWLAALWAYHRRPPGTLDPAWWALATLLAGALTLRILLVAALHACGALASDRYMFPAAALLVPAGLVGLHAVAAVFWRPAPDA
jgi:hypothetical protein